MTIDLFVPCYIDQFYPETAFNAIKILKECDITVNYNSQQTCCGKIAFESGFWEEAKELGEKFISIFNGDNPIIGLSISCIAHIQNHFKNLFHNSGSHLEYQKVSNNIFSIEDFLVNHVKRTNFGATFKSKAVYHDSCSSLNHYRNDISFDARKLLKNVDELELIELDEFDTCSGCGSLFSPKYSALSAALNEQEVKKAIEIGAKHIIVSDSGCMINLNSYIKHNDLPISVIHIIDVISSF